MIGLYSVGFVQNLAPPVFAGRLHGEHSEFGAWKRGFLSGVARSLLLCFHVAMQKNQWTREELIVAFNLYCKTPFGRIHTGNPAIVELARLLGRTPSSVSWKLANFARLDPTLRERNIKGAAHGSKAEVGIWDEFRKDWEQLAFKSEVLLAQLRHASLRDSIGIEMEEQSGDETESERTVRMRVKQHFFRKTVLASYDFRCCITGLAIPELLNASHIVPWAIDIKNRINPSNGLCLNSLHDRAFDRGLLTITPDYRVRISPKLKALSDQTCSRLLLQYENMTISLPARFAPDSTFLVYHNEKVFQK